MLKDATVTVRQEPLLAPILSLQPVDMEKAWEALKATLHVVQVVAKPPLQSVF